MYLIYYMKINQSNVNGGVSAMTSDTNSVVNLTHNHTTTTRFLIYSDLFVAGSVSLWSRNTRSVQGLLFACVQRCHAADLAVGFWVSVASLRSPISLPMPTSDPWHQEGTFLQHSCHSLDIPSFFGPSFVNPRDGCASAKIPVDQQFVKRSDLRPRLAPNNHLHQSPKSLQPPFLRLPDSHFELQQVIFARLYVTKCCEPWDHSHVIGWLATGMNKRV